MIDEARIIELEAKLAYQEDTINKLSEEFYQQQKQIEKLQIQQRALAGKIGSLQEGDSLTQILDDRPPHY